jgi:L-seryl-tRNA(Ser) seleniumtransferase
VAFSGGKAIRGPQGTGFLAGRRDLIASVALQHLDMDVSFDSWNPPASLVPKEALRAVPRHGIGRGFKVAKEQIVGLIVALQMFTEERVRRDYERWVGLLEMLRTGLAGCPGLKARVLLPQEQYGFPCLEVEVVDCSPTRNARALADSLRSGSPPIHVAEGRLADGSILIHPVNLDEQSVAVIAERLTSWCAYD